MSDYSEIFSTEGNEGEHSAAVSEYLGVTEDSTSSESTEGADAGTSSGEDKAADDDASTQLKPEESDKGEESAQVTDDTKTADDQLPEEDRELSKEELENVLADPKTPKWFRSKMQKTIQQMGERDTVISEYSALGTKEEIAQAKEFYDQLFGSDEVEGSQVSRTPAFAKSLIEKHPERAIELINELVASPSPLDANKTIFDQLLESPEVQEFLKEQNASNDDPVLKEIPQEFREAYKRLTDEEKDDYKFASDAGRQKTLERVNAEIQRETEKAEADRAAAIKKENDFKQVVETTTMENFSTVTTQFKDSLQQIPFSANSQQNAFWQATVEKLVTDAATMSGYPAGENAKAALKHIGVDIPKELPELVGQLETHSKDLAQAKRDGNAAKITQLATEIATVQKQLLARSNEISAAVSKTFNPALQEAAAELAEDQDLPQHRPSVTGNGSSNSTDKNDYSGWSYREIVAMGKENAV